MGLFQLAGGQRLPLGMDIDHSIVLSEVTRNRASMQCHGFAILEPLPEEVRANDMVLDERVRPFANPLRDYVRRLGLTGRRVAISPPSENVTVRQFTMPPMPVKALRTAIARELGKRILLPFDDPLLDYAVVPAAAADRTSRSTQLTVLVVATSKAMVWPWIELSKHVGLRPVSLEPGLFAAVRLLQSEIGNEETTLVVVLGHSGFDLGLVVHGIPVSMRFVGVRPEDYRREGTWDKLSYSYDVVSEVDRSIAFMDFNVLGGTDRTSKVMVVDRVGCSVELVAAMAGRIDLPVRVPVMPYGMRTDTRLNGQGSSPSGEPADIAARTAVSVGLTLPEERR